jgi:hypothetical protein
MNVAINAYLAEEEDNLDSLQEGINASKLKKKKTPGVGLKYIHFNFHGGNKSQLCQVD